MALRLPVHHEMLGRLSRVGIQASYATDPWEPNGYTKYGIDPKLWNSRVPKSKNPPDDPTSVDLSIFEGVYRTGEDWPLKLQVKIARGYNFTQPDTLRAAMRIFMQNVMSDELWSCAERHGTHNRPDIPKFKDRVYTSLRAEEHNYPDVSRPNILFLTRFWFDNTTIVGFANVNYYDFKTRKEYWVNLNSQKIGPNDDSGIFNNPYEWAGIIAHEMLHNLGLRHPHFDRTGERTDFIYAFGDCFTRISHR